MHIPPLILAGIGFIGVITGRLLFGRWFNHFSLYSLIWGTGLSLFEWRLIEYIPLTAEVWMLLLYAWIAFMAGAAILILARKAAADRQTMVETVYPLPLGLTEKKLFVGFILLLSIIALFTVIQHWSILLKRFGSITGVLINGRAVYQLTVAGKIAGRMPYFDSLALAAICLTGIYSARAGKIKLLVLFPLAITILSDIALGGRAKMIISGILFLSAYFLTKIASAPTTSLQPVRRLLTLVMLLAVVLTAAEFVRSFRGAQERFYGVSKELRQFENNIFLTPSIYLYLSSHPGVFNAYWKAGGEPPVFPGSYTFAPLYRILARIGLADHVSFFQKFYGIPIYTNTGTYLRELHSDFGLAGIFVAPYALGFLCTWLWLKIQQRRRIMTIALLAHIYVVVAFTYLYQVTRLGQWAVSLIAAVLVGYFIDSYGKSHVAQRQEKPPAL
jgi:oligosaccharide repeat unit polymerase